MREFSATFKYCCATEYKKLVHKYLKTFKKQYGRNIFKTAEIICTESSYQVDKLFNRTSYYGVKNCCKSCGNAARHGYINQLYEMKVLVRIENGN